jgi:hypothetical protein
MARDSTTPASSPDGGRRDGDEVPTTVVSDLLSEAERRRLLEVLVDRDDPVPVDDVAAALSAGDDADADVTGRGRRAARTRIYQDHLPVLVETGVVRFDSMLATVEFDGPPRLVERLRAGDADEA